MFPKSDRLLDRRALLELEHRVLNLHAIVTITDCDGRILYCNDKFTDICGYTSTEILGQTHALIHSGHHPHGFFKTMFDTIKQSEEWHGTVCNRAKDGHLFWVETTVQALMDEEDVPIRYIAVRTDVTKQKQTEDRLRLSHQHYMSLISNLNDVLFTFMPDGVFDYVSPQWTTLIGHDVNEVVGLKARVMAFGTGIFRRVKQHSPDDGRKCWALPRVKSKAARQNGQVAFTRKICPESWPRSVNTWMERHPAPSVSFAYCARMAVGNGYSVAVWS